MKKLGLMQQALIGVAATEELQPSRAWGAWTKWLLDRSLAWYDAETVVAGRLPDPIAFGVNAVPLTDADAALAATRIAANAARAVAAGLGRARAVRPPALYAYDPDTGRLAVTTPAYSTAIVAVNQGAFPYGGVDLARLLDGRGRVAATIGGQAPVAFGLACATRRPHRPRVTAWSRSPGQGRVAAAPHPGAGGRRRASAGRARACLRRPLHRSRGDRLDQRRRDDGDQPLPLHAAGDRGSLVAGRRAAGRAPASTRCSRARALARP